MSTHVCPVCDERKPLVKFRRPDRGERKKSRLWLHSCNKCAAARHRVAPLRERQGRKMAHAVAQHRRTRRAAWNALLLSPARRERCRVLGMLRRPSEATPFLELYLSVLDGLILRASFEPLKIGAPLVPEPGEVSPCRFVSSAALSRLRLLYAQHGHALLRLRSDLWFLSWD